MYICCVFGIICKLWYNNMFFLREELNIVKGKKMGDLNVEYIIGGGWILSYQDGCVIGIFRVYKGIFKIFLFWLFELLK